MIIVVTTGSGQGICAVKFIGIDLLFLAVRTSEVQAHRKNHSAADGEGYGTLHTAGLSVAADQLQEPCDSILKPLKHGNTPPLQISAFYHGSIMAINKVDFNSGFFVSASVFQLSALTIILESRGSKIAML